MANDSIRRAAEMLLNGATMLAQPCPYCSGVRVIKNGRALCASCGSEPQNAPIKEDTPSKEEIESQILDLSKQLGASTESDHRKAILDEISHLSGLLVNPK